MDGDGFCSGNEVLGEVCRRFLVLEVYGQVKCNVNWFDIF